MKQRITTIPFFYQLLWAIIGLAMTICANFLLAYTTNPPWMWLQQGVEMMPLNISCQVAAVMLVACLDSMRFSTMVGAGATGGILALAICWALFRQAGSADPWPFGCAPPWKISA
jgi:uncharacterized membrane protein YkvI